ncbi:MAG: hypothetical protein R2738_01070 [Bacteroides graminisolvens]
MRPSVDAGLVYRFEQQKWRIYPSFGVGYVYHLRDGGFIKSSTGSDEVLHTVEYKQQASSLTLNMGLSANCYFSSAITCFSAPTSCSLCRNQAGNWCEWTTM